MDSNFIKVLCQNKWHAFKTSTNMNIALSKHHQAPWMWTQIQAWDKNHTCCLVVKVWRFCNFGFKLSSSFNSCAILFSFNLLSFKSNQLSPIDDDDNESLFLVARFLVDFHEKWMDCSEIRQVVSVCMIHVHFGLLFHDYDECFKGIMNGKCYELSDFSIEQNFL